MAEIAAAVSIASGIAAAIKVSSALIHSICDTINELKSIPDVVQSKDDECKRLIKNINHNLYPGLTDEEKCTWQSYVNSFRETLQKN